MCRTWIFRFGIGDWIFLLATLHLFTYAQGGDDDEGIRLTLEPSDVVVLPGEAVLLPCAAVSRAAVRVTWRFDQERSPSPDHGLAASDAYRKQLANGSLSITSMSERLAGLYQCVVSADNVGTIVSRTAMVYLAEVPQVLGGPRSILAVVGSPVLLPCGLRGPPRLALAVAGAGPPDRRVYATATPHVPPPTLNLNVTWYKNGQPLAADARASLSAGGALELEPARAQDGGVYECRVGVLGAHQAYRSSPPMELQVNSEVAEVESPPRFVATPQSATVMEGASVTLDCAAVGNPKPEIVWLNNGVAIDLSDLDSRFHQAGSGSLRVRNARPHDAGVYTCRAHNRLDSCDVSVTVSVQSAPRVQLGPKTRAVTTCRERGDVTLQCNAKGKPAPVVTWLKDGEPLTPNDHDISLVDGSSLRISGVLRLDAGMFQCWAKSSAGDAFATVRLVVMPSDGPEIPIPPKSYTNSTHDILNSLISSDTPDVYPDPEYIDIGETSSSYTVEPEYDINLENTLHAAKGLDVIETRNASVVSTPKALKAVIVKHRFVTLTWERPENTLEEILGYAVMFRAKGSQRERVSRGVADRYEMNVASLQPNTTYQFSVVAYTEHATSPPTETIEITTPVEESPLNAPRAIKVVPVGPRSLKVTWQPPIGPPPDIYIVSYTETETNQEQQQQTADTAVVLSDLQSWTNYLISVTAGRGGGVASVPARTPPAPPAAPPANVTAHATGHGALRVRWQAPRGRAPLTGYKLRYRAAVPRARAQGVTTPADATSAELRHLDTNTTYQIRVCALNANGSGPFSDWVSATTLQHQRVETSVPGQPPPLTTRAGRDWISVWWADSPAPEGPLVRGYWLGWGRGVPDSQARELPAQARSHVIRALEPDSEYVISLRASNALGLGPAVYATVRTRPASPEGDDDDEGEGDEDEGEGEEAPVLIPPVGLKVIMLSGTTAVVYWTDPTLPKGQTATDGRRYVVRWSPVSSVTRPRTYNASDLNCMLGDLRPHTQYEFAVKLIKGGRESAWSMLVTNTTLESLPTSAPRDLRVSAPAQAARAADLTWSAPAKPNGVITGYVIMYVTTRAGAAPGDWTALTVTGDRHRARAERLRPRTTYSFKIQARNSKGLGPFSPVVQYTTGVDTNEGSGLSGATSAWLWASAGGACAVLALAAALALSLCCRRTAPRETDTSTYQKSSASAALKPPDLWIHHDQMELKHIDKHASNMSNTTEVGSALASSTLTLGRAEYESAPRAPASLDRRHYVPTYVESSRAPSCAGSGSDETAIMRASPASGLSCRRCCDFKPMTGVGCASTCERRPHRPVNEQITPLVGIPPMVSPQANMHPPCSFPGGCALGAGGGAGACAGADVYACARERGHYVAYEPLGHYTHRDSVTSEPAAAVGSLPRRVPPAAPPGLAGGVGAVGGAGGPGGLHSFTLSDHSASASDRSTPTHCTRSVRETSPYKKSASSSPGHIPNRLQLGSMPPHLPPELEPLTPSRSTERLHREMQNLEGLMKDLSAITQTQFHC